MFVVEISLKCCLVGGGLGCVLNRNLIRSWMTDSAGLSDVCYKDNKDARHIKTYEVALKDKDFVEGPWPQNNLDNGADFLIPVPPPLCGVLIIGEETIVYCSASAFKAIPIRPSITRAYGRVDADGSRYLIGNHNGVLHLLVITHEKEKVTGLKTELLGETSIASTISYLDNSYVYIGSSNGDSQ